MFFYVDNGIMVLLGKYINIVNIDVDFYVIFYIVMWWFKGVKFYRNLLCGFWFGYI